MNNKNRKIFKNLLKLLEKHLNLILLLIFVFTCLYVIWIFYNFVNQAVLIKPEVQFTKMEIKKDTLSNVVGELIVSEQEIIDVQEKEYQDIFK